MSTDEIPGWALEAAKETLAIIQPEGRRLMRYYNLERLSQIIAAYGPQPSAEVAALRKESTARLDGCIDSDNLLHRLFAECERAKFAIPADLVWEIRHYMDMGEWTREQQIDSLVRRLEDLNYHDQLREAGNRLAEALEILKGNFEKGGCSRNADYRALVEIIAHWRATTEG